MAQGSKEKYTDKQKRKAEHIEEGYEKRGVSKKEAESRAWATVNKEDKGGKKERLRTREEEQQDQLAQRREEKRWQKERAKKLTVHSRARF